ncbi:alanine and glycine-rich protein-like [Gigantopelta aegis]|uniref:alanine and glycine-rich protein-like n=1 Tax=Gigantopelta aegis TaxID=1735272 RepID=UPI001B88DE31|nr:alanine and glycine-rich protein-like [Gigantopelta aegis]
MARLHAASLPRAVAEGRALAGWSLLGGGLDADRLEGVGTGDARCGVSQIVVSNCGVDWSTGSVCSELSASAGTAFPLAFEIVMIDVKFMLINFFVVIFVGRGGLGQLGAGARAIGALGAGAEAPGTGAGARGALGTGTGGRGALGAVT